MIKNKFIIKKIIHALKKEGVRRIVYFLINNIVKIVEIVEIIKDLSGKRLILFNNEKFR